MGHGKRRLRALNSLRPIPSRDEAKADEAALLSGAPAGEWPTNSGKEISDGRRNI